MQSTHAYLEIPCTESQAKGIHAAYVIFFFDPDRVPGLLEYLERDIDNNHTPQSLAMLSSLDKVFSGRLDDLAGGFSLDNYDDGICLHADTANTEIMALFAQAILNAFEMSGSLVLRAAHMVDPPKDGISGFGGHTVFITRNGCSFLTDDVFVNSHSEAHENGLKFYFAHFTEHNGEPTYRNQFLMVCRQSDDPEVFIRTLMEGHNNGGQWDTKLVDFLEYSDATASSSPVCKEIAPDVYAVLRKFHLTFYGCPEALTLFAHHRQ